MNLIITEAQQLLHIKELEKGKMVKMYRKDFQEIEGYNKLMSSYWLTNWNHNSVVTERIIMEAMDQTLHTNYLRKIQNNKGSDMCRRCGTRRETVKHILSGCDTLAQRAYTNRHNAALRIVYWWLAHKYGFQEKTRSWTSRKKIAPIIENDKAILWWDTTIQTVEPTKFNRPDMILWIKDKKRCVIIEMSVPWDTNINKKYKDKVGKYGVVRSSLAKEYPEYTVKQSNIIIGALGTVLDRLPKELEIIDSELKDHWKLIQRCVLIHSADIAKNFCCKA